MYWDGRGDKLSRTATPYVVFEVRYRMKSIEIQRLREGVKQDYRQAMHWYQQLRRREIAITLMYRLDIAKTGRGGVERDDEETPAGFIGRRKLATLPHVV